MRDKYNLNLLPKDGSEEIDFEEDSSATSHMIPGMGFNEPMVREPMLIKIYSLLSFT